MVPHQVFRHQNSYICISHLRRRYIGSRVALFEEKSQVAILPGLEFAMAAFPDIHHVMYTGRLVGGDNVCVEFLFLLTPSPYKPLLLPHLRTIETRVILCHATRKAATERVVSRCIGVPEVTTTPVSNFQLSHSTNHITIWPTCWWPALCSGGPTALPEEP